MTRRKKIVLGCVAVGLAVASLCLAVGIYRWKQEKAREEEYSAAEALLLNGEYGEAFYAFDRMDDSYRNAESLMYYARARISYDMGYLEEARDDLLFCSYRMKSREDMPEGYEEFRSKVLDEYEVYEEQQKRREEAAYRRKIHTGVPFVGMPESEISNTSLGAPRSKMGYNREMIGGHLYPANLYDFYQNGRLIFTARCVQGEVTQVWDKRNKASQPKSSQAKSSSSGSRKASTPEPEDDPYNAKDYRFPEDFYEDHWDDFFDFEDAEDYFYDHTKNS